MGEKLTLGFNKTAEQGADFQITRGAFLKQKFDQDNIVHLTDQHHAAKAVAEFMSKDFVDALIAKAQIQGAKPVLALEFPEKVQALLNKYDPSNPAHALQLKEQVPSLVKNGHVASILISRRLSPEEYQQQLSEWSEHIGNSFITAVGKVKAAGGEVIAMDPRDNDFTKTLVRVSQYMKAAYPNLLAQVSIEKAELTDETRLAIDDIFEKNFPGYKDAKNNILVSADASKNAFNEIQANPALLGAFNEYLSEALKDSSHAVNKGMADNIMKKLKDLSGNVVVGTFVGEQHHIHSPLSNFMGGTVIDTEIVCKTPELARAYGIPEVALAMAGQSNADRIFLNDEIGTHPANYRDQFSGEPRGDLIFGDSLKIIRHQENALTYEPTAGMLLKPNDLEDGNVFVEMVSSSGRVESIINGVLDHDKKSVALRISGVSGNGIVCDGAGIRTLIINHEDQERPRNQTEFKTNYDGYQISRLSVGGGYRKDLDIIIAPNEAIPSRRLDLDLRSQPDKKYTAYNIRFGASNNYEDRLYRRPEESTLKQTICDHLHIKYETISADTKADLLDAKKTARDADMARWDRSDKSLGDEVNTLSSSSQRLVLSHPKYGEILPDVLIADWEGQKYIQLPAGKTNIHFGEHTVELKHQMYLEELEAKFKKLEDEGVKVTIDRDAKEPTPDRAVEQELNNDMGLKN